MDGASRLSRLLLPPSCTKQQPGQSLSLIQQMLVLGLLWEANVGDLAELETVGVGEKKMGYFKKTDWGRSEEVSFGRSQLRSGTNMINLSCRAVNA